VLAGLPEMLGMDWDAVGWQGGAALGYATFLSLLVAYLIWNRSVKVVGPSRTVIYMCLTPLIAVATAAAFLGERPRPLQAVGAALIIGGVLVTRGAAGQRGSGAAVPEG
jgi:drug/metabolite transporter (DMT)-like permease